MAAVMAKKGRIVDCIRILIAAGADVYTLDNSGWTAGRFADAEFGRGQMDDATHQAVLAALAASVIHN